MTIQRVEQLLEEAERLVDPRARALARELAGALIELLGEGFDRVQAIGGPTLARQLADDDLVGNLLVLVDRHPDPAIVRARAALEAATATLSMLGAKLVRVDGNDEMIDVQLVAERGVRVDEDKVRGIVEAIVVSRAADIGAVRVTLEGGVVASFVPLGRVKRRVEHAHEQCDLCGIPLGESHEHLYAPATRSLKCACLACSLILPTSEHTPYRKIPKHASRMAVDTSAWLDRLGIPVGVAAMIKREDGRTTIHYPGPAGLVESELGVEIAEVAALAPEVEALLVANGEAWRVGIDVVFSLIGELRRSWQGITGGGAGPAAIAHMLEQLR